jgi:PAS domain S-box-containing protein
MTIRPPDPTLRLAAIVESSDDAIVSKDLNGIITSWNRGAEQLFGYTADEAVGQSVTILIPTDRLSEEDMVLSRIRNGQRVEHFETIRRRKDGTPVAISLTVSPIRDAAGTIVGASKIARNISDRKRIEGELQELQRRLMALAVASASLLGSPDSGAVAAATIELARDVFAADGYALWRIDPNGSWAVVRSFGISNDFAARAIGRPANQNDAPAVPFAEPLVCPDVEVMPMLSGMRDAYRREGIASMIVFPFANLRTGEIRSENPVEAQEFLQRSRSLLPAESLYFQFQTERRLKDAMRAQGNMLGADQLERQFQQNLKDNILQQNLSLPVREFAKEAVQ